MNSLINLLAILLVLSTGVEAHDITSCGKIHTLGITGVKLLPDPPIKGEALKVRFTALPTATIDDAKMTLKLKIAGIAVSTVEIDLCKDAGLECPLTAGVPITGTISHTIPSAAPSWPLTCDVEIVDHSKNALDCFSLKTSLSSSSSSSSFLLRGTQDVASPAERDFLFEAWRRQYHPGFATAEETMERMRVWTSNLAIVRAHNAKGLSYTLGMNAYAHLTYAEFRAQHRLGQQLPLASDALNGSTVFTYEGATEDLPDSVDWSTAGAVTPVKNQGHCGSCWSFATTGAIEGALFIASGSLISLSEQQLVSCDKTDSGCGGGLPDSGFEWVHSNGGLCTEDAFPYTAGGGTQDPCGFNACKKVQGSAVTYATDVDGDEDSLKAAVKQQPVAVAIEADQRSFQLYAGGVFTGTCGTRLDHAVLAVGYGVSEDGKKFWNVKNSWGDGWGESGYIRIERGKAQAGGQCGILNKASFPNL